MGAKIIAFLQTRSLVAGIPLVWFFQLGDVILILCFALLEFLRYLGDNR